MALTFEAVSFDAVDPQTLGVFWAGILGREIDEDAHGLLLEGTETQIGLRFMVGAPPGPERNRLHIHLTSATAEEQRATVETALRLGGRRYGTRPLPIGRRFVSMADPGGNEFCAIEPDNNYLAGCGFLGEVTCDGSRQVGKFWRDALGWPLVWDHGEQTGIQSPQGGTKISWDKWNPAPKRGRDRQRFHLVSSQPDVEAGRLVALGAKVLGDSHESVELADPDGNRFSITVPSR